MSIKKYKALFNDKEEEELRTKLCINISGECAFIIPLSKYGSFFVNGEKPLVIYSLSFFGYHTFFFKIKAYSFLLEEVTSAILDATIVEHEYSLHISSLDIDVEIKRGKKLRNNCLRLFELKDDKEVSRNIKK